MYNLCKVINIRNIVYMGKKCRLSTTTKPGHLLSKSGDNLLCRIFFSQEAQLRKHVVREVACPKLPSAGKAVNPTRSIGIKQNSLFWLKATTTARVWLTR